MSTIATLLGKLVPSGAKLDLGLPIGPKLAVEMKAQAGLRQEIRKRVAAHASTFLSETDHQLRLLKDRACARGYRGIAVLVDSLEKLRGTSATFDAVLNSAERLFAEEAPYLKLPVHVLYTIPPALILRLKVAVHFMPMMKLWERDGAPFEPGRQAAQAIIRQRIQDEEALQDIFGRGEDRERRLQTLIEWSAGYPREIIRLLQNAVADAPLSEAGFRRLLGRSGDDYRRLLLLSDFDLLARVFLNHDLTPASETERRVADRLLSNQVILRYQNDSEWYEVHPAVRDMPALREAVQRMSAAGTREASEARGALGPAPG